MRTVIQSSILALTLLALHFHSCKPATTSTEESAGKETVLDSAQQAALIARGTKITSLVTSTLVTTLFAAMEEKGPAGALEFCSLKAVPITDSISIAEGVAIQRISHKPRNPENAASAEEQRSSMDINPGQPEAHPTPIPSSSRTTAPTPSTRRSISPHRPVCNAMVKSTRISSRRCRK